MIQLYHSLEYTQGLGSLLQTYFVCPVCFVPICNCWMMETYVLSYIPKMLYIYSIAYYKWNNCEEKKSKFVSKEMNLETLKVWCTGTERKRHEVSIMSGC